MQLTLLEKTPADDDFLFSVYASTRAAEMALLVHWSEEQKKQFLRSQFAAQHQHYLSRYPDAFYGVIRFENHPVGRLYTAELTDEIRIIDLTVLPEFRLRGIGGKILSDVLQKGASMRKPLQIYIESFNPSGEFFERRGFKQVSEQGVHVLWRWAEFED